MKKIDIYKIDKYEITEMLKKLRIIFKDPKTDIFDMTEKVYEEVFDTPTDNDGYTPMLYLSEDLKSLLESFRESHLL